MFLIYDTKKIWPWKNASMIKKKDNFSHFTSYFEEYGFTKWRNPIKYLVIHKECIVY